MDKFYMKPFSEKKDIVVSVPGSKSITNRALLLAAISSGKKCLKGVLFSEDTRVFLEGLLKLGFEIETKETSNEVIVKGCGGKIPKNNVEIYVGSAGTAARFLTAMLALSGGFYTIDASMQMKNRPIKELLVALEQLGVRFEFLEKEYAFPLKTLGRTNTSIATVDLNIDKSSQFLSALLLNYVYLPKDFKVNLTGKRTAKSYVKISERMIEQFRALDDNNLSEKVCDYYIEPDVSAACYFYAMAAVNGIKAQVLGVNQSMQGDIKFLDVLKKMGCEVYEDKKGIIVKGPDSRDLKAVNVDLSDCSDQTMTLAAVSVFAKGETVITGIGHIRGQESDRIAAIYNELTKLGIECEKGEDYIKILGNARFNYAKNEKSLSKTNVISTYNDHRMAMSFAILGTRVEGIVIDDPMCCKKTFENYFEVLTNLDLSLQ